MPKLTPKKYGTTRPARQSKFRLISARAPEELHQALAAHSEKTGIDKSEIIRGGIAELIGFEDQTLK